MIEILSLIFSVVYFIFILVILYGLFKNTNCTEGNSESEINGISILIPFRNEEKNLPSLLSSLLQQTHSNFEIIFIDDHSEDSSKKIIETSLTNFNNAKLIQLGVKEKGKKSALEMGIRNSSFEKILTTDADCTFSSNWISTHSMYLEKNEVVTGRVDIRLEKGFFSKFQQIDSIVIQAVTFGMGKLNLPISMSGANLSYRKEIFRSLKPYEKNRDTFSGDDIYFLHHLKRDKKKILFCDSQEMAIETRSESLVGYFQQRIRWMKKSSSFSDITTILCGLLIFLSGINLFFIAGYQLFTSEWNYLLLISVGLKISVDFLLLFLVALRWKKKSMLIWFAPVYIMSIFLHSTLPLAGWFIPVNWKGRKI